MTDVTWAFDRRSFLRLSDRLIKTPTQNHCSMFVDCFFPILVCFFRIFCIFILLICCQKIFPVSKSQSLCFTIFFCFSHSIAGLRNTSVANIWVNWFVWCWTSCIRRNWHSKIHRLMLFPSHGRLILEKFQQSKSKSTKFLYLFPFLFIPNVYSFPRFIHRDTLNGTTHLTKEVLAEAGFQDVTDYDVSVCQHVAAVVSHRAALLVSITTSVIMARLTCPDISIAIDGSVYKNHPRMDAWLNRILAKLNSTKKIVSKFNAFIEISSIFIGCFLFWKNHWNFHFWAKKKILKKKSKSEKNIDLWCVLNSQFRLMLAEDGSGKGAALTAAIALKLDNRVIQ